jgi:DNA primase
VPKHSEATLAAIKRAVDIVALVGEYLPLHRAGSKFKALCPFHDDKNPSLEVNPDRQSFKCWSCGAGGDVFDFVKDYERVDFPEALRMLADRAGVALDAAATGTVAPKGPSKSELLAVNAWAEGLFVEALASSTEARGYLESRGLSPASVARFRLGYAPGTRGWLSARAKQQGFPLSLLERAGLVVRPDDSPGDVRERFRGRLMFPIHDPRGRTLGFGGRVLPAVEAIFAAKGKRVAKYLNSPETPVFQKRRVLYAADLARAAAREAGWVAVVEGYTDVIAAHQVGLCNVVGTLGTALGDDHVLALRRLADRVVLVFDGDEAGQHAADRSLELFLGHEVDVRVLTLPEDLDPCEFLLENGADAFRQMVDQSVDPLAFALERASARFDLGSSEGSRQASEWVLSILARVPSVSRAGLDVKVAKALDGLSRRLGVRVSTLERRLRDLRRESRSSARPVRSERTPPDAAAPAAEVVAADPAASSSVPNIAVPSRPAQLDPLDRELLEAIFFQPAVVEKVATRVAVATLRDAASRAILQVCYDLWSEGELPTSERIFLRLQEPALRRLAAQLAGPIDPAPLPDGVSPPWEERVKQLLNQLARRDLEDRIREVREAMGAVDTAAEPETHRALHVELVRLMSQRPVKKSTSAS